MLLVVSVLAGAALGLVYGRDAVIFKPLGDIFLNLLFTIIIPLVFFSISSAVAGMTDMKRLGTIMSAMIVVFTVAGFIAASIMIIGVTLYPPAANMKIDLETPLNIEHFNTSEQIVKAFTVSDFRDILSKKNMLALIIFSILTGLGASAAGEKGKAFSDFLSSATEVMMKVIGYIMLYAPIGLCAYFAYLTGSFGTELLASYVRVITLYFPLSIMYFFVVFTFYVYLAAGGTGVKAFWKNIIPPSVTSLATGSSMVTIPSNLDAADRMGVPRDISDIIIPVGATLHMEGSCLAAVLKIAFLFGVFQMDFSGAGTILTAIGIGMLTGMVVSGIPGGGTIGELLIISLYGFPPEAFPLITMIGTLVDAPATMVNAVGDNVASILVARILGGKNWSEKTAA
ncbi:MAG: C4-dicarboxylate transport protein [Syntrophus sp. SKADARSKE-3]|nr:C4-dicarboxylate transport protein [Syntrophus sp. SKADARSKE-3]